MKKIKIPDAFRKKRVTTRFTEEEYVRLLKICKDQKLSLSRVIRFGLEEVEKKVN
jgi:hypothetical protein